MGLLNKKIAYCFLVSNESRDFYLLLPFIYFIEKFENFEVSFEFIWDAHKIRKKRPDLVILPNARGHSLYYETAKYCSENGILVFNHDSEGNFNTALDYDFWGFNHSQELFCPVQFTWNLRVKLYLEEKYSIPSEKIVVSGAPGFDKYQFLTSIEKNSILEKYGKSHYTKVAGYAGWAFGKIHNKELNDVLSVIGKPGEMGKKWLIDQRDKVESCLKCVIEAFPEVLFILKKHPRENFESDFRDSRNEMNRLVDYPNVLYLKDAEEIQNLIQISDLWIAFESTSIMEAWLTGKPTLMINPDSNFRRAELWKGSIAVKNEEEIVQAFKEMFVEENRSFFAPDNVIAMRESIIADSIGFADGLNHLRCAKAFKAYLDHLKDDSTKARLNLKFLRLYLLLHIGKWFYIPWLFKRLPKFKKTVWIFENYRLSKVKEGKITNYPFLDSFYERKNLKIKIHNGDIWKEL